jgi:hypothetical protein
MERIAADLDGGVKLSGGDGGNGGKGVHTEETKQTETNEVFLLQMRADETS